MMFLPFSYTSTSTFKSDRTAFATYATATSAKRFRQFLQLLSPATGRYPVLLGVMLIAMTLTLVTGCGSPGSVAPAVALGGNVQGGHRPVVGASVQLYAASSVGLGSVALPLLQKAVASDSNGNFSIPAEYSCPSASSAIYVVASGGSASSSAGENSALMLTAMLGPCSGLAALGSVSVNEVTTVGSVWPLAHYFTSPTHLGYASNDTSFPGAVSSVPEFINLAQGSSPGTPTSTSYFAENNKLNSLADVLAACVSSSGGTAGDGSPCGELFSMASSAGGTAPTDTLTAAIKIAQNPDNNVAAIYGLVKGSTAFEPTVTAAPSDWTLPLISVVATPSISPVTGTYAGTQDVTITDATAGSTIYYTTDGTVPTSSSTVYTGPIPIAVSSTVNAIAVLAGASSGVASSTLTITSALPAAKLAFLQQPSNALTGATMSPAVTVAVQDSNGNTVTSATNPVTLALTSGSGLTGTLTATPKNGVATFSNLSIGTAGSYTLSATSPSLTSATSAGFSITAGTTGPAAKLAFVQQPTSALTGATISPAVTVAVEDSNGNPVTSATNPITVALAAGTGLAGTLTATPQNGVATFSNLSVSVAGSYTLSATSTNLTSATSTSFTIGTSTSTNTPAGTVATPVLSPAGGSLSGTETISMSTSTPGAGIWYTTDGSTPTLPAGGVPTGTTSTYTAMCQPIAQPALSALKNITAYGASTGAGDNTAAIQSACTAAGTGSGTGIYIPAGTFNHTSQLTLNCNVYGQGQSSELYCPSPTTNGTNCQLTANAGSPTWSNFAHVVNSSARDASNFNVHLYGPSGLPAGSVTNARMDTLFLEGGNAGGFFNDGTTGDILTNNGVFNTKADCNYETDGATNTIVDHTFVQNCGDDGISNVSYSGESGGPVNGSLDQWNNIQNEPSARGISVAGGENITIQNNLVQNTSVASGIYVAVEDNTEDVDSPTSNVAVKYNSLSNAGGSEYQVSLLFFAGGESVTNALALGNIISDSTYSGIGTYSQGGTISDVSLMDNVLTNSGTGIVNSDTSGTSTTNTQCSGNTLNGTVSSTGACGGTNPDTATGSPMTYSGCVVGTAQQYTGPITINSSATVKAIAVIPGLTNSSVASGTYSTGP
jgi:hypothetical protein